MATTTSSSTTFTPRQFAAAYRLARRHGHEWTELLDRKYSSEHRPTMAERHPELLDLDRIDEICSELRQGPSGISAPIIEWVDRNREQGEPDWQPTVTHTTGTGRLTWQVFPDGTVRIFVDRPGHNNVFVVTFPAVEEDWQLRGEPQIVIDPTVETGYRHIAPLLACAQALGYDYGMLAYIAVQCAPRLSEQEIERERRGEAF